MAVPVQVTFRDMPPSNAVTSHVEKRAAKLETFHDRIVKCHVVLEEPHRHHKHGEKFHVRIDIIVPGKELVVSKNLDGSMHAAVDDAFGDAERLLTEHLTSLSPDMKNHTRPPHGVVAKIFHDRGYGFIEAEDGHEVYFHENSVLEGKFEKLRIGAKVRYAEEDGDKGPQASTVHAAA